MKAIFTLVANKTQNTEWIVKIEWKWLGKSSSWWRNSTRHNSQAHFWGGLTLLLLHHIFFSTSIVRRDCSKMGLLIYVKGTRYIEWKRKSFKTPPKCSKSSLHIITQTQQQILLFYGWCEFFSHCQYGVCCCFLHVDGKIENILDIYF